MTVKKIDELGNTRVQHAVHLYIGVLRETVYTVTDIQMTAIHGSHNRSPLSFCIILFIR